MDKDNAVVNVNGYLQTSLTNANSTLTNAKKERSNSIIGCFVIFILVGALCVITFIFWVAHIVGLIFFIVLLIIQFIVLLLLAIFVTDTGSIKQAQANIDSLQEEIELYEIRSEEEKILANKQFKIHQKELKRYYDLNISQIKFLSTLGIALIAFGIIIIMMTIVAYILVESGAIQASIESNVWFFVISISSGILIDCIGAFFITMYTQNMKVAISLHSKLAGSNNLLLANLIVAKIEDKGLREQSLAAISKIISSGSSE